ncbi:tetratricopeptide repeat protein [Streptomyces xiamenensis]
MVGLPEQHRIQQKASGGELVIQVAGDYHEHSAPPHGPAESTVADDAGTAPTGGPGRPIGEWEPHDLEVHPAGPGRTGLGPGTSVRPVLPGYVARAHDAVLADAVRNAAAGRSGLVVLVGSSSTGKTRACWEAVQPLAELGWRLWHPFDPTRAQAALDDLHRVGPRTVVWLNEAQHYLGDRAVGEQIAAAIHRLLVSRERGPVLVLGTLWPEYHQQYTALPAPGAEDLHSRVRELLSGRTLSVPDAFDTQALAAATALARDGDRLLEDALTRARSHGKLTQDLAGALELLNRYRHASPAAKALLEAAMDARRLGVGLHLPQAFLTEAAPDYLTDTDYDQLTDDWIEQAFSELAEPVHGKQAPLRRTIPRPPRRPPTPSNDADTAAPLPAGPVLRLADYLEQHGRTTRTWLCPPASFWHAAHTRIAHPDDLENLAQAAEKRHRLQWAHHLRHRAADHGSTNSLVRLAELRAEAGDEEGAEALARQAFDYGDIDVLVDLARLWVGAGDQEGAERLFQQAADYGDTTALVDLARLWVGAGDQEGAERLFQQAADHGDTTALVDLARLRAEAGDQEGGEALARQAADRSNTIAMVNLAHLRVRAGDQEGAERLFQQAADHGNTYALVNLAELRVRAGDQEGAERLLQQAADHGNTVAMFDLAHLRVRAGDQEGGEALARQAADRGDTDGLVDLARLRAGAGDQEGAERLLQQAADHGNTDALVDLAGLRVGAGDQEGAEALARQAADHGTLTDMYSLNKLWPYGLDPDGAPTPPWQ